MNITVCFASFLTNTTAFIPPHVVRVRRGIEVMVEYWGNVPSVGSWAIMVISVNPRQGGIQACGMKQYNLNIRSLHATVKTSAAS